MKMGLLLLDPDRESREVIVDRETHWYKPWYLKMRAEEEMSRAVRFQLPLTVVILRLSPSVVEAQDRRLLNQLLMDIVVRKLRRSDIPGMLDSNEYAILLTHTKPRQADKVVPRLLKAFEPFSPTVGSASYPEDTNDPERILLAARHRAIAQMNGRAGSQSAV
jgi:hypothetical protein